MDVATDSVSIDIHDSLVCTLEQKILGIPGRQGEAEKFTIFRVPDNIRQKNKQLYEPRMVSIGPYHHGRDAFHAMEMHKLRYLRDYLSRNTRNSINHCISKLRGLEFQARQCYFEEVKLQTDEFLEMMLLDGCFIIEFLMKLYYPIGESDVIFHVGWVLPIIRNDLLLLENQIPFFIIQELFNLLICSDQASAQENNTVVSVPVSLKTENLVKMLLEYLSEGKTTWRTNTVCCEIKHILHLYELCYVLSPSAYKLSTKSFHIKEWLNPLNLLFVVFAFLAKLSFRRKQISTNKRASQTILSATELQEGGRRIPNSTNERAPRTISSATELQDAGRKKANSTNERAPRTIPSATELQEAGIIFKRKKSENVLDIKFQNGILEIPFVSIEETRRSRLLNLVSFEQCDVKLSTNLTSYACFMGALFKTTRDVTLLHEKGIIDNLLPTDEELVSFFNWPTECSYLDYEKHYLKDLFIDVNRYYNSDWHKWRARLKRDYFANTWTIIPFFVAFALLALSTLQTVYAMLSFHHQK
ncbi:hypothetical protein LUZ62_034852 [Rhynchospora pubera]|uniref:Uncharacterized protein n=1 Tax=Rhynchospora pubera TaxID=906938 RepID=A0AAV8EVR5_9POAL|nr:hypothetical protein LUZ62_034852 [Rhynchospora pubera]